MKKIKFITLLIISLVFVSNVDALTKEEAEEWLDQISTHKFEQYTWVKEEGFLLDFSTDETILSGFDETGYNEETVEEYLGDECSIYNWYTDEEKTCTEYYDSNTLNSIKNIIKSRYVVKNYIDNLVEEKNNSLPSEYRVEVYCSKSSTYKVLDTNVFTITIRHNSEDMIKRSYVYVTKAFNDYTINNINSFGITKTNGEYHIDFSDVVKPTIKYRSGEEIVEERNKECEEDDNCDDLTEEEKEPYIEKKHLEELNDYYYDFFKVLNNKYDFLRYFKLIDENTFIYYPNIPGGNYPMDDYYIDFIKIKIDFANPDNQILENTKSIVSELKDDYIITNLHMLNMEYYYGSIPEAFEVYSVDLDNDSILYRYADLKKVIEGHPEYKYRIVSVGGAGDEYLSNSPSMITLYYNNILYAAKRVNLFEYKILYVDKNEEGTLIEKAKRLIDNYFKGDVDVEIVPDMQCPLDLEHYDGYDEYYDGNGEVECPLEKVPWINTNDEFFNERVNADLGTNENYTWQGVFIYKDNQELINLLITEVDSEYMDNGTVESTSFDDISISTDSYEVPVDSTIQTEDVLDEDYMVIAGRDNNYSFTSAYDLRLYANGLGTFISQFKHGLYVYFPLVGSYNVGDSINVYYITADGKIGSTIIGTVVKMNNKFYVKFKTTHFSTFALGTKNEDTNNDKLLLPVVITKKLTNNAIKITWDKQNATKYILQISTDKKKWTSKTLTTNSYTHSKLTYGKTYYYRVKACNGNKCTSYSNINNKKLVPNKLSLKTKSIGKTNIKISWSKESITGYEIYMGISTKKMKKVKTITKNSTITFNKTKLKSKKTYFFKARAYKKVGSKKVYGSYSSILKVKTK